MTKDFLEVIEAVNAQHRREGRDVSVREELCAALRRAWADLEEALTGANQAMDYERQSFYIRRGEAIVKFDGPAILEELEICATLLRAISSYRSYPAGPAQQPAVDRTIRAVETLMAGTIEGGQ